MILITGGTGLSGGAIVEAVARTGKAFSVMVRDPARGAVAGRLGARIVQGDFSDMGSLERCLAGVERVLLNSGPTEDLVELQTNLIRAAKRARVGQVVKLSAVGADSGEMAGRVRFLAQHRAVEAELVESGLAWTMLRPTFFMQNLLGSAGTIKSDGAIYMPAGEARAPYVDIADIGAVAAAVLTGAGHAGRAYELTGPEALSFHEMAREIGGAIGKDVKYVPVSEEAARAGLLASGIPAWQVEGMLELMREMREGRMSGVSAAVEEVTGRRARTFGEFARGNGGAFIG
jgi:uncharacterized protein YbjT (DUF2867 family)